MVNYGAMAVAPREANLGEYVMRHPFAGIVEPAQKSENTTPTRRSLFGLVAGAVAGTVGLIAFGTKRADAQGITTLMVGEEGGRPPRPPRPPGNQPTTRMIGEEGGRPPRQGWKK